jgi:hypothetical protein
MTGRNGYEIKGNHNCICDHSYHQHDEKTDKCLVDGCPCECYKPKKILRNNR